MSVDLRELEARIRAVAEEAWAVVLDVLPQGGSGLVVLDEEQLAAVISRVKGLVDLVMSRGYGASG